MGKIRWGFLSTAEIGKKLKIAIDESSDGQVVAVASRSLQSAEAFRDAVAKNGEQVRLIFGKEKEEMKLKIKMKIKIR